MQSDLRTTRVSTFAALVIACLPFGATAPAMTAELPDIVIILVDDMGYGDPGCNNAGSKIPTPNIDSLARAGMRFTDAHAPGPLCHMSRYGLLTGRYPFRTDVGRWRKQPLIDIAEHTDIYIRDSCKMFCVLCSPTTKAHYGYVYSLVRTVFRKASFYHRPRNHHT